jgi:hypothetical protein
LGGREDFRRWGRVGKVDLSCPTEMKLLSPISGRILLEDSFLGGWIRSGLGRHQQGSLTHKQLGGCKDETHGRWHSNSFGFRKELSDKRYQLAQKPRTII